MAVVAMVGRYTLPIAGLLLLWNLIHRVSWLSRLAVAAVVAVGQVPSQAASAMPMVSRKAEAAVPQVHLA